MDRSMSVKDAAMEIVVGMLTNLMKIPGMKKATIKLEWDDGTESSTYAEGKK